MTFDFTPVTLSNPQAFAENFHEMAALYAGMKPTLLEAIERDGKVVHSESRNSQRVHELGTAVERLDDIMPNLINKLMFFADDPTVGGREEILKHRQQNGHIQSAGHLIDNAAREFTDPEILEKLKAFDVRLHQLFHDVDRCRPQAVGPHSAAIAAEDRNS